MMDAIVQCTNEMKQAIIINQRDNWEAESESTGSDALSLLLP